MKHFLFFHALSPETHLSHHKKPAGQPMGLRNELTQVLSAAVISTEVEKSHAGMEQPHECHKCSPPHCHFDRSGEISCPSGTSRMAVGDFSTQSLNRAQIPISPYLHAAPLEMTCGAASFTVMEKGNKWTGTSPAPLSFRRKPVSRQ